MINETRPSRFADVVPADEARRHEMPLEISALANLIPNKELEKPAKTKDIVPAKEARTEKKDPAVEKAKVQKPGKEAGLSNVKPEIKDKLANSQLNVKNQAKQDDKQKNKFTDIVKNSKSPQKDIDR